jgi:hypothetical protein
MERRSLKMILLRQDNGFEGLCVRGFYHVAVAAYYEGKHCRVSSRIPGSKMIPYHSIDGNKKNGWSQEEWK